ncbi:MAG: hypothetical protein U9Q81_15575 [Pseudomonadota bacterium]|nr:hypothetical protein [Pseudomonadota bacterium]
MSDPTTLQLDQFAHKRHLEGLSTPSLRSVADQRRGYSLPRAHRFLAFQDRINAELLQHPVITANPYTAWFRKGEQSFEQVKSFIVQFSVFSNRFLVAQLLKMINAETLEEMRASKEILANEIGVVFNSKGKTPKGGFDSTEDAYDAELVSTEGSVEGGVFHFRAGHLEWLLQIASGLGLGFGDVGKTRHGTASTQHFCDELARLYGSEDYAVSQAASYAVENWAAAGFWNELIEGLGGFNRRTGADLPLGFFTWHSRLEAQHAQHTQEELEALYFSTPLDEDRFVANGNEMLDGVMVFWHGLETQRRQIAGRK